MDDALRLSAHEPTGLCQEPVGGESRAPASTEPVLGMRLSGRCAPRTGECRNAVGLTEAPLTYPVDGDLGGDRGNGGGLDAHRELDEGSSVE